jgi:glycosyltransferase involved in cell wall biosynthesis
MRTSTTSVRAGDWAIVRVAVVVEQCLNRVPGGTGRYTRELTRVLAETAVPGDSVHTWAAWHRDMGAARIDGADGPRRLPLPRRALAAAWERGVGPAPRGGDVVHAPTLLVPPHRAAPLVVTIHDAVPWTHPETLTARGASWHQRMGERAARTADAVIVPTQAVAEELAHVLPNARRVVVIGEGVSDSLTVPADAEQRATALALPSAYVVSLATLEPRKGLDVALHALASPMAPDLPLLVVGQPGWGGVDLVQAAAAAGLSNGRVRALGRLSDPDVAVVLSRAAALIMPSRSEGFGLPMLEAMSLRVPIVASAAPALVEVAAGAAVHHPVDDSQGLAAALRSVLTDSRLSNALRDRGARRAAAFTWTESARRTWELYRSLL